ncbi:hypothetical protein ACFX10_030547 [Malus domestica]
MAKIPVVDFSKEDCLKPGTSCWISARNDVCHALQELGCFTAILPNKVPKEIANTFFSTFGDLFDPSNDIPEKPFYAAHSSYGHQSYGILNGTDPQNFVLRWLGSESADLYAKVLAELDQTVTRMVFENYGVEKYHDDLIQSTVYSFRMMKYDEPKKIETNVGFPSHTDRTFSTIIHQNHVSGLEINTKGDDWVLFEPPPSSVIFLAGDAFQIWSNNRIRPCRHKVTLRENDVRYTFGVFARTKGVIHVPNELVDEDHPLLYKPINHLDFLRARRIAGTGAYEYATQA